jgi:hypothetical protein
MYIRQEWCRARARLKMRSNATTKIGMGKEKREVMGK